MPPVACALVLAAAMFLPLLAVAGAPASAASDSASAVSAPATRPIPAAALLRCPANLAGRMEHPGRARQLVTVEVSRSAATFATLMTWARPGRCWVKAAGPFSARVGANGVSTHKVEGDGTTPAGAFGVGPVMYGIAPNPGVHYRYHRLVCGDWWDEDPASRWYNEFKHIVCGARPTWTYGDSEALWTETVAYQSFAFIEYNTHPVVPGRGSAIFLHDNIGTATTGCVSLSPPALDRVLEWLRPDDRPLVAIGTAGEIERS